MSIKRRVVSFAIAGALLARGAHAEPLDLLVYGASGKIGSLAVAEALERGHHVTAVSRDPARIELTAANLSVVRGDLLDPDSIAALDYLRTITDVAWTYVTPPKNFTNGERTGEYRIGGDRLLEDAHGRSRISRADFAVALIDEAESGAHAGERFAVAY